MKVSMPTGSTHGWGIAGSYLIREIAKLPPVDGVTLHSVGGHAFLPLNEADWGRINIGYCFFEEELRAYHFIPAAMQRWDYMVAGSHWCEYHLRIAGMERTTTILQGVDQDVFSPQPQRQDDGRFIVFSGGKFEFRKGQDIVIAAMKIFMARHSDVWLACAWHNSWWQSIKTMEQSRLINFTWGDMACNDLFVETMSQNGMDLSRVILYPKANNDIMSKLYAESDIGLFPNRCEGGNNMVMCEYMATGRPVITSARTGHADVVTHENSFDLTRYEPVLVRIDGLESGVWFEASVEEVLEQLENAYADRPLIRRKAAMASRDMQGLSWAETARRFHELAVRLVSELPDSIECRETLAERIDKADAHFFGERHELAKASYRLLLQEFPLNADIYNRMGTVLDAQERYQEAAAYYAKAVYLQPDFYIARYNMANTLKRCGDIVGCLENLNIVVSTRPDFADAWQNLAACYFEADKLEDSARCLEKVIEIEPDRISCYADLGDVYYRIGRELDKALLCFDAVLAARPDFASAYNSKGLVLHEMGDYAGAEVCYRHVLTIDSEDACTMNNLGLTLLARSKPQEAIEWYSRALLLEPEDASTNFNMGIALLLTGDYKHGWPGYERRFNKLDPVYIPVLDLPRWNGEPLKGKTLLVRTEQAYGDCIQFARFLPLLSQYGGSIVLECMDDRIKPLFSGFSGVDQLVVRGKSLPPADFQIPIASIPGLLGIDLSSIPFPEGYLYPAHQDCKRWRAIIDDNAKGLTLKVGIVWGGRKTRLNADRSLKLSELAPLFDVEGVRWYSLQIGEDADQMVQYKNRLVDLGSRIITFADTAAIVSNLNLVITIDTALAHLAGAMGCPAWVMLKATPDWRWLIGRLDSPWYNSLQLFRQRTPGDWASVITSVADELKKMISQEKKLKSEKDSPIQ